MEYLLLAGPITFIAVTLILGKITPNYTHKDNFISELSLGKYGLYQKINFIVSGILISGLCLLLTNHSQNSFIKLSWFLGAFIGFLLTLTGVWDTDFGLPKQTKSGRIHDLIYSSLAIPSMGTVYLLLGWGYRNSPIIWAISWFLVVFSFVLYKYYKKLGLKHGTAQRILIFSAVTWMEILAVLTLAH